MTDADLASVILGVLAAFASGFLLGVFVGRVTRNPPKRLSGYVLYWSDHGSDWQQITLEDE